MSAAREAGYAARLFLPVIIALCAETLFLVALAEVEQQSIPPSWSWAAWPLFALIVALTMVVYFGAKWVLDPITGRWIEGQP